MDFLHVLISSYRSSGGRKGRQRRSGSRRDLPEIRGDTVIVVHRRTPRHSGSTGLKSATFRLTRIRVRFGGGGLISPYSMKGHSLEKRIPGGAGGDSESFFHGIHFSIWMCCEMGEPEPPPPDTHRSGIRLVKSKGLELSGGNRHITSRQVGNVQPDSNT